MFFELWMMWNQKGREMEKIKLLFLIRLSDFKIIWQNFSLSGSLQMLINQYWLVNKHGGQAESEKVQYYKTWLFLYDLCPSPISG